jgi:hypothetical protein
MLRRFASNFGDANKGMRNEGRGMNENQMKNKGMKRAAVALIHPSSFIPHP